jgi:hypothetical protein
VCRKGAALRVCVHPAYASVLDEAARQANEVAAPLAGIPGVPSRAEQVLDLVATGSPRSAVGFEMHGGLGGALDLIAPSVAGGLVSQPGSASDPSPAQQAVELWLTGRAAGEEPCPWYSWPEPPAGPDDVNDRPVCEAARRFGQLSEARQRAWLERNYADLRAGKLRLEDMP